jgi:hypothetical protein
MAKHEVPFADALRVNGYDEEDLRVLGVTDQVIELDDEDGD